MVWLSFNGAKIIALILNALHGIVQYADKSIQKDPSADMVFALRVIQGELSRLSDHGSTRSYPSDLLWHFRNLSGYSASVADQLEKAVKVSAPVHYAQVHRFIGAPYNFDLMNRRSDPRLQWKKRTTFSSNLTEQQSNECIAELVSSDGNCRPSAGCLQAMLETKHLTNYALSRQTIYFTLAKQQKVCRRSLLSFYNQSRLKMEEHLVELCTNTIHEMDMFLSRVAPDLDHLTALQKDLLMQHIFVCGQHGFSEVALPRLLWMILRQQRIRDGCYPLPKDHALPDIGRRLLGIPRQTEHDDCSPHSTAVASGSLVVFLAFIVSSPSEFHLIDGLFSLGSLHKGTPTEGKFKKIDFLIWIDPMRKGEEREIMPLGQPPPLTLHADLIAFITLIIVFCCLIGFVHQKCTKTGKQLYGYAYKKL